MVSKNTRRLVYGSLTAALIALLTAYVKLPVPITNGYIHLGDGAIFLSAILLGPYAGIAAAVGSALADALFGYYIYIIPTFIIKGLMGLLAGLFAGSSPKITARNIAVYVGCELLMTAGYFLFETFFYGIGAAAGAIGPNLIQGAAGVITGCVLVQAARKIPAA